MDNSFKTYLFKYFHDGSEWLLEIKASSLDDAQARINRLPWAKPVGELVATVPANYGLIARALCWVRNMVAGRNANGEA